MIKIIDTDPNRFVGKTFGRLKVLEFSGYKTLGGAGHKKRVYKCRCSFCKSVHLVQDNTLSHGRGNRCFKCCKIGDFSGKIVSGVLLIRYAGKTKSGKTGWFGKCACGKKQVFNLESLKLRKVTGCRCNKQVSQGGLSSTGEYRVWCAMRGRCKLSNDPAKNRNYFGRGIRVCKKWSDSKTGFKAFLKDMGLRPSSDHSIDRKDGSKGYVKSNCKWATTKEQMNNRRSHMALESFPDEALIGEVQRRKLVIPPPV